MRSSSRLLHAAGRLKRGVPPPARRSKAKPVVRRRKPPSRLWPWLLSLGGALVLHGVAIWPLFSQWVGSSDASPPPTKVRSVSLPPQAFDRNRVVAFDAKRMPPPEREIEPPKPVDAIPKGRVVKVAAPKVETRPEKADFVAETNNAVEKQTRARQDAALPLNVTDAPKVGVKKKQKKNPAQKMAALVDKNRPASGKPAEKTPQGRAGPIVKTPAEQSQNFVFEFARKRARPHLDIDLSDRGSLAKEERQKERQSPSEETRIAMGAKSETPPTPTGRAGNLAGAQTPSGGGTEGLPNLAALTPTLAEIVDAIGMPARNHLPDLESANSTAINTWRWQHAPFFNRIRDQLYQVWDPHSAISRHDPLAYEVNHQTRQTVLRVTIDRAGNVVESVVDRESGARYLDSEAIRAFDVGGPFPNPPAGLFGENDRFTFNFGFSVDGHRQDLDFNWKPY